MAHVDEVVFRSDPNILSTVLMQKNLTFDMRWKQWKPRLVVVTKGGILQYGNGKDTTVSGTLQLKNSVISYIPDEVLLRVLHTNQLNKFIGLTIKCQTTDGFDTYFRMVAEVNQIEKFKAAIKLVATVQNLSTLGPVPVFSAEIVAEHAAKGRSFWFKSVMRRTIAHAMKAHDMKTRRENIQSKRDALKWLPVLFANDLIHGSWYRML